MLLDEDLFYNERKKEILDEGVFTGIIKTAATLLGYTGLAGLSVFGAAMLAKSAISKQGKVNKYIRKLFKKDYINYTDYKSKSSTKRENENAKTWERKMPLIHDAIKDKNFDKAAELWNENEYNGNDEAARAIILWITDIFEEPPLFVYPQGNEPYFAVKKVIGIKYAKAAANAVLAALKMDKSYYKAVNVRID